MFTSKLKPPPEAKTILKEAKLEGESLRKEKELKAKEKFIELKAEHEKVILSRDKKMAEAEKRTRDKESQISSELSKNKKLNADIENKINQNTLLIGTPYISFFNFYGVNS